MGHFGESLRELRRVAGLTQTELASSAGMSQTRISNLERGACLPGLKDLDRLRRVLPMDLTEAVEGAIATLNGTRP